jgi:hypothetical protein
MSDARCFIRPDESQHRIDSDLRSGLVKSNDEEFDRIASAFSAGRDGQPMHLTVFGPRHFLGREGTCEFICIGQKWVLTGCSIEAGHSLS